MRVEFVGGAKDGAVEDFPIKLPFGGLYFTATSIPEGTKVGDTFSSTLDGYMFDGEKFHFVGTTDYKVNLRKGGEP